MTDPDPIAASICPSAAMERPGVETRHLAPGPHLASCEQIAPKFCASLANGRPRCARGTCYLDETRDPGAEQDRLGW